MRLAFGATARLLSKSITIPQLSPTHSQARILSWYVTEDSEVTAYDLVLKLECSSDLVTEAHRKSVDEQKIIVVDTQDEGIMKNLKSPSDEWLPVGSKIGVIDDGEGVDGDWTWQAYLS